MCSYPELTSPLIGERIPEKLLSAWRGLNLKFCWIFEIFGKIQIVRQRCCKLKTSGKFLEKKIPWSKDLLQIIRNRNRDRDRNRNRGQPKDSSSIRIIRIWVLNLTTPSELPEFYTWLTTFRTTKMIFNSCRTLFTDMN